MQKPIPNAAGNCRVLLSSDVAFSAPPSKKYEIIIKGKKKCNVDFLEMQLTSAPSLAMIEL
jgi:hypothetical protein